MRREIYALCRRQRWQSLACALRNRCSLPACAPSIPAVPVISCPPSVALFVLQPVPCRNASRCAVIDLLDRVDRGCALLTA